MNRSRHPQSDDSGPERPRSDLSRQARGRWGEDRAASHLRRAGFEILSRNWLSPERELRGELDLVARRGQLVVFCEVKTRRSGAHGGAAAGVTETQQHRIRGVAELWLRDHEVSDVELRFDVITIEGVALTHYEAAF